MYQFLVALKHLVQHAIWAPLLVLRLIFAALMLLWISLLAAGSEVLGHMCPYAAVSCYLWVLFSSPLLVSFWEHGMAYRSLLHRFLFWGTPAS